MLDPIFSRDADRILMVIPELAGEVQSANGSGSPAWSLVAALATFTIEALEAESHEELLRRCFEVIEAVLEADEAEPTMVLNRTVVARLKHDEELRQKAGPYIGGFLSGRLVELSDLVHLAGGSVDRFRVTLNLSGFDLDPEAVTSRLQVMPSVAHRRGEKRPSGPSRFTQGLWAVSSSGTAPEEIEDHINSLLDQLPPTGTWRDLRERHQVCVSVGIFMEDWNRGFELSNETLGRLREIGASIDFDIYCDMTKEESGT